jgi:hypothetical protein
MKYFTRLTDQVPELFPTPETPPELTVTAAFVPLNTSTTLDDLFIHELRDTIVAGALARLLDTPNQAYSDSVGAARNAVVFRHGINVSKIEANRGHTDAAVNAYGEWV